MSEPERQYVIQFGGDTAYQPVKLNEGECLSAHLSVQNSCVLFGCRTGICGTCLVEIESQDSVALAPPSEEEKEVLAIYAPENSKARLACQIQIRNNLLIRRVRG